jgi:hypothetical protein
MGFTFKTIVGQWFKQEGAPQAGWVVSSIGAPMTNGGLTIDGVTRQRLDYTGSVSFLQAATNDPGTSPSTLYTFFVELVGEPTISITTTIPYNIYRPLSLNSDFPWTGTTPTLNVPNEYSFTQASAASVWVITHDLGHYPIVSCHDTSGNEVFGTVTNPSTDTTVVTFLIAIAGSAVLV